MARCILPELAKSAILLAMRSRRLLILGLLCVPLAACGGGGTAPAAPPSPAAPPAAGESIRASGTFAAPPPGVAVTYDQALVPVGSTAVVDATENDGRTTVTMNVTGFEPNRRYGAHSHVKPCGATGADAGPHFQFTPDPVQPSVDPAYANPQNEIWLDFTTDAQGAASATSTVNWEFPDDRRAGSVVIHTMPTSMEPGKAGTAGDRAGCITVGF
ncbi:MAG TPA: superoxide dismutase [Pseudonocardia sp.]